MSDIPAKCPLARKIQTWRHLRKHELRFEDGVAFLKAEPHWPLRPETIPMLEKTITPTTSKKVVREWFVNHPPTTAHGLDAFMKTLSKHERQHRQFIKIFRAFWLSDRMSPHEQSHLFKHYGYLLSANDHQQRVELLLWKRKTVMASGLLSQLHPTKRSVYQEWINLIHRKSRLIQSSHPGIATVLAQNALNANNSELSAKLLTGVNVKRVFDLDNSFFATLIRNVRNLVETHHYSLAYRLAFKGLSLSSLSKAHTVELHWLSGWILTAFLKQPSKGFHHFVTAASLAKSSVDQAHYAFWAGKAAKASGKHMAARQWFRKALQFPQTFYGQMASKQLKQPAVLKAFSPHSNEIKHFLSKDIVKAIQFLHKTSQHTVKNVLLDALQDTLKTHAEYVVGFYFTQKYSTPYYTIHYYEKVNKVHNLITPDVFLQIDFQPEHFTNVHFIHAMAFNESRFHPMIKSDKGALGLMQITPLTGRHLACKGHAYEEAMLYKDPAYNLKMASIYLHELFQRFNQSYILLAAAYNAGPTYISKWVQQFGRPKHDDDYEWIERLAFKETRDYVKKLLGMMLLYKHYSHAMPIYAPQQLMEAYVKGYL